MENLQVKADSIVIDLDNIRGLKYCTVDEGTLVHFVQKPFIAITSYKIPKGFRITLYSLAKNLGLLTKDDKFYKIRKWLLN
jgi:hypothetical protein